MKFRVDPWSAEYGASVETDLNLTEVDVNVGVERAAEEWDVIRPARGIVAPLAVLFVDGVRRVDARVWIESPDGDAQPGVCASFAAGVVRCADGGLAELVHASVGRVVLSASPHAVPITTAHGLYEVGMASGTDPEALWLALQQRMGRREVEAAESARADASTPPSALVVVDGPLSGRAHVQGAIGLVKTHAVAYLSGDLHRLVGRLEPETRTPVFTIGGRWPRHSWYARLPGGEDAPWAGVVRCEASSDLAPVDAAALADVVTATLPRYASEPHKDARAPQNLIPIGGLERELRRRLGDAALLYRGLRVASRNAA